MDTKEILVYIASPLKYRVLNNQISEILKENNIASFLPHTIDLPDEPAKLKEIGDKCFEQIDKAQIVVVVSPFGLSTASEVGYAINRKRKGEKLSIILFDQEESEHKRLDATLTPYFDKEVGELTHLVNAIIIFRR